MKTKRKDLILVENWVDQAALDEHYAQPYIAPIFEFYKAISSPSHKYKMTNVEG